MITNYNWGRGERSKPNMSVEVNMTWLLTLCIVFFPSLKHFSLTSLNTHTINTCKKTLVHAFVTSKVDYCNSLLYGVTKYLLQRLQRVLNCAARIVFKSNKYDHITPLLRELHWLPIQQRIEFKILLITFKALNKQAPTYLTDLLISYTPSRSLRSSSKNLLKTPGYNLKSYGGRSFVLASAVLWNSLPQSLRDLQSVETFKRKLKKHLFLRAYMEH